MTQRENSGSSSCSQQLLLKFLCGHSFIKPYFSPSDQSRITPAEQVVEVNSTAHIECISSSLIDWIFNSLFPPHFVDKLVNKIQINNVQREFGGTYECVGTNDAQEVFWAISVLYVKGEACGAQN